MAAENRLLVIVLALLFSASHPASLAIAQSTDEEIILDGDVEQAVPEREESQDRPAAADAAEEAETAPASSGQDQPSKAQVEAPPAAAQGGNPRQYRPAVTRIVLRSITFSPSEYLSQAELETVRRRYVGQAVALADLGGLGGAVEALYREQGILLARAVVTGVDLGSGRVAIDLQEARIGNVAMSGADHISQRYIAYRLGIAHGDLADNRVVDERVLRLSLTDNLPFQAEFAPGVMPGIVDLTLSLSDQKPISAFASVDSFGKKSTGVMRGSAGLIINSLTGWNDPFSISGTVTEGSVSGSTAYSRVIHPSGTRFSIAADASTSRTLATPVARNRSYGFEAGLAHPLVAQRNMRLQISASFLGFTETGTISGAPLVDQQGYGGRLGASQFFNGDGWFASFGQTFTGISWTDGIFGGPRMNHYALGANAGGAVRLDENHSFSVQVAGQLALNARAPSKYRMTLAGPSAVRGYDQDVSSGDSGIFLRGQLERSTPLPLGNDQVNLRPFAFADAGRAFDFVPGGHLAQDPIASIGAGASFGFGRHVLGEVYFAKPLLDANGFTARDQYEVRGSLSARF